MASQASLSQVQSLYVAYYGRPADPVGLAFWAGVVDAHGGDVSVIVQDFGNAPEFQARFANLGNNTLVNNLYQQMFGRDAEPDGLNFWVGLLASGSQTPAQVAQTIASLATNMDLQVLTGRVALADAFTGNLATNTEALAYYNTVTGLEISRDYLNQVKGTTVDIVASYVATAAETVATLLPSTGVSIPLPTVSIGHVANSNAGFDLGFTITASAGSVATVNVLLNGNVETTQQLSDDFSVSVNGLVTTYTAKPGAFIGSELIKVDASATNASGTTNATQLTLASIDTTAPAVALSYDGSSGTITVTSDKAGIAGLYDTDSNLIAGTIPTHLTAGAQGEVVFTALSALTVATVKVQDIAGNFADNSSDAFALGTNGADTFSSAQDSSTARYGFGGDDTFEFTNSTTMSEVSVYGGDGIDTIRFTSAFDALNDGNLNGDVGNLFDVENLQLFGASSINMGGEVHAAGINKILTGNDDTTLRYDDSLLGQITVDGSALDTGKTLALSKFTSTADFVVINLHGNLDSTQLDDSIHVTAVSDSGVTIMTGSGNDTLTGSAGNDIINAGNGSNSITGGEGIDTLSGGNGIDTFNFATGDAAAYVFSPLNSGSNISDGALFTFTSGTDVITNFTAGTDKLLIAGVTDVANQYGNNYSDAAIVSNGNANFAHGDYDTTAHTFTVSSGGNSTLVIFNSSNSKEAIVLTGVNNLTGADLAISNQIG
jgi:hypothetical protein